MGNQAYILSPMQKSTQAVAEWHEDLPPDFFFLHTTLLQLEAKFLFVNEQQSC